MRLTSHPGVEHGDAIVAIEGDVGAVGSGVDGHAGGVGAHIDRRHDGVASGIEHREAAADAVRDVGAVGGCKFSGYRGGAHT